MENRIEIVKIKICGLYRMADADYVNQYKPDYVGFVFDPPSHRNVTEEQAERLRQRINPSIPAVGVFVNEKKEKICRLVQKGIIQIVQLHGQEDEEYIRSLKKELGTKTEIWKAYKIRSLKDIQAAEKSSADEVLYDNGYGTGNSFDWTVLEAYHPKRQYLLAGGITAENMAEAMEKFHPKVIDISSGVETDGKKNAEKIREVIEVRDHASMLTHLHS